MRLIIQKTLKKDLCIVFNDTANEILFVQKSCLGQSVKSNT